jgi:hypothetical protein
MIFTFDGSSAIVAGASMLFGDAFAGPMGGSGSRLLRLRWFRRNTGIGGTSPRRTRRRRR